MGLREKVTIALVIIALIQIACRPCMPRSTRKASLKRYLNDLKPVKNNPASTPYSTSGLNKTPKQTLGRTAQHARNSQNSLPNKSLYQTYNFPENEYPLDNSPRDAFRTGMNFNNNCHVNNLQKSAQNLGSSAINDLKKEMKMKRKLLSNRQINNEDSQLRREMSARKLTPNPDSLRLFNSGTFPEVQYPLNTMETWGPNYWNYLPFTQEKPFNGYEQQIFNSKTRDGFRKPFTRLTKATASKFLQSYDKLKEEQIRTSTENSKRSNVGQKGLNFTKTATCEKVSDDFITASLVSNFNNPSQLTEIKKTFETTSKITPSSENTCPVTEYSYHLMPIPYKVVEESTENIFPVCELHNNTEALQDVNNNAIDQALQFIQEILLSDDASSVEQSGKFSTVEKNMNTSNDTDVLAMEDIPTTLMDSAKNCTVTPTEELSLELSDDVPTGILQNSMSSHPDEITAENTATVAEPLNIIMPLQFNEPITYGALTNAPNSGSTPLSNSNAVSGSTSIIIIPMNNNVVGKPQSHMIESTLDTPIILYIPSTQNSGNPSKTLPSNQYVSLSLENLVPNDKLYNNLSYMAPLQNDSSSSNVLVTELLNGISDSGSSLPMFETLPTNSTCYNNENTPSSMREKSFANNLIDNSLTDNAPLVISACDEKSLENQSTKTYIITDTLTPTRDSEQPLFDFAGSDFASLRHGPYNNIINNELPIIAREINSNQQFSHGSSKDSFSPKQNVTLEYSQKNIPTESGSEESHSDKKFSSETSTYSLEKIEQNTPLFNSLPNLQVPTDNSIPPSPIFNELTKRLPKPIDKILIPIPLVETPDSQLPLPTETLLTPTPLSETVSDKLPVIIDVKLPAQVLEITTDNALQSIDNTLASSPILDSSPKTIDNMTLNTALLPELYKIRQLIDKMLSSETPTDSQLPPIDTTLSPIFYSDYPLLPMSQSLQTKQIAPDSLPLPEIDEKPLSLPEPENPINNERLQVPEILPPIPVDETSEDTHSLPVDNLHPDTPLETDSPPLLIDETVLITPVSETSTDNKPYLIDNLVTPLSETATFRTKNTPNNGVPSKMDLLVPDIYEVSRDNLPLFDNDLQITDHQKHTANPESRFSLNDWPMQVVETLTPNTKVSVSDSLDPAEQSSLFGEEGLEATLLALPENVCNLGADSLSLYNLKSINLDQPSDETEAKFSDLPCNDFSIPVDKILRSTDDTSTDFPLPINKTPSTSKLSITKALLENVLSDINKEGLSSPVAKPLPVTLPQLDKRLYCVDEKSLLSVANEIIVLPVEKICLNIEHTDNPIEEVPFSKNITATYLSSDLPLPMDEMHKDKPDISINHVKDIDEDVTKESPHSSVSKDSPPLPVDKILPNSTLFELAIDNNNLKDSEQPDNTFPLEEDNSPPEISSLNIPQEILSPTTKTLPNSNEDVTSPTTDILPHPTSTPSVRTFSNNKSPSSSKLPITKALLENVLAEINTKGLSLPKARVVPVAPRSQLDKTLYFVESPLSDVSTENVPITEINEESSILTGKMNSDNSNLDNHTENLPIDKMYEDKSDTVTEETEDLNKTLSLNNPTNETDDLPSQTDKQLLLIDTLDDLPTTRSKPQLDSRIPITKALLEKVLSDITEGGFAKDLPITPLKLPTKNISKDKMNVN